MYKNKFFKIIIVSCEHRVNWMLGYIEAIHGGKNPTLADRIYE